MRITLHTLNIMRGYYSRVTTVLLAFERTSRVATKWEWHLIEQIRYALQTYVEHQCLYWW